MKRPPCIFVTGVGACGVGEGIAKAVLMSAKGYRMLTANMHAAAPLLFRGDKSFLLPAALDPAYTDLVADICRSEGVDFLFPGSEAELRTLCRYRDRFMDLGTHLIACGPDVIAMGDDKWNTHLFLRERGFATPMSTLSPLENEFFAQFSFPMIVKPRVSGRASQNVFSVSSCEELETVLRLFELKRIEPIIQEEIGDASNEFTVSVVVSRDGVQLGSIAMRRELIGGFTYRIDIEDFEPIRRHCEQVVNTLHAYGPVNLQLRLVDGNPVIFEINPRCSGTTPFRAAAGFNEIEMVVEHVLHGTLPRLDRTLRGVIGIREFSEVLLTRSVFEGHPINVVNRLVTH